MDQQVENIKMPPNSADAEQSVIGGLMLDNRAFEVVSERLQTDDFYRHSHRLIYQVICTLAEKEKPFDVLTLSDELEGLEELDNIGGRKISPISPRSIGCCAQARMSIQSLTPGPRWCLTYAIK